MTLANLINGYIDGGTGSVLIYYNFDNSGIILDTNYSGCIKNTSPCPNTELYTGVVQVSGGAIAQNGYHAIENFYLNEKSGVDLGYSALRFGPLTEEHASVNDHSTQLTFLFSFEKKSKEAGILFGSLVKDFHQDGSLFGRGFNIGVNSRNQLFFQGISDDFGEYVLTADEIELSNKNICSVSVSPYNVTISRYQLGDDFYEEQSLFTNSQIQNNNPEESFYIGGSPTFYRSGINNFSGYMDQFLLLSGFHTSPDLKSVASGFVATGISSSGVSFQDTIITGYNITLVLRSGITGFEPYISGYKDSITTETFIEFTLVEETLSGYKDGQKFLTGYTLPNSFGGYLEETTFLYPNNYTTTGDNAFSTLGLSDQSGFLTRYTLESSGIVNITGSIPLYGLRPVTGLLIDQPTGYEKEYLTSVISKTGTLSESLSFKPEYIQQYKPDYLYYQSERI